MSDILALAVHRIGFLRCEEKIILRELLRDEGDFLALSLTGLRRRGVVPRFRGREINPAAILSHATEDARWLATPGAGMSVITAASYPYLLSQIFDPPYLFFYRSLPGRYSSVSSLFRRCAAVVGTRHPSGRGEDGAFSLSAELGESGVTVVSGLARGVDAAAHAGCMAAGGRTAAVLGHGPDLIYPAAHRRLAADIISTGGAILSEFPPGTPPRAFRFPQRNRIISGLAPGAVIIEAPGRSGALITAEYALDQGREVMVYLPALKSAVNEGGRNLAESGAAAVSRGKEVVEILDLGENGRKIPRSDCR